MTTTNEPNPSATERFFELSLDLLCVAGFDGTFHELNPAWQTLLGFDVDDLIGKPYLDLVHPDDRSATEDVVASLIVGQEPIVGFECRFRTADGTYRSLRWRATLDADAQLLLASATDITDELANDRALAAARQARADIDAELAAFFDLSVDLLAVSSIDGTLLQANRSWLSFTGADISATSNANFIDFVHDDDAAETLEAIGAMVTAQLQVADFEHRYRSADGTYRWISWSAAIDEQRDRIYGVGRDVTERREMQAERQAALEAADEASRAKSAFLANMSHELRTPLNSVIGFANILAKRTDGLDPASTKYLDRIRANGEHLLAVINDVLDLSKIEAGRIELVTEPVDVASIVREVVAEAGSLTEDGVTLSVRAEDALEPLATDAQRLRQVLVNLVGNACKFTTQGTVEVELLGPSGHPTAIVVRDTGEGIPPDRLATIFDRFSQVDETTARKHGGTGLGLAICDMLCRLLGFELSVTSEVGVGSTFQIDLCPQEHARHHVGPGPLDTGAVHASAPDVVPGRALVLVIDDDPDSHVLLRDAIEDLGHQVVGAVDGREGIAAARRLQPSVIVLDLMMPGIDGFGVMRILRADPDLSSIPVVICSIVADDNKMALPGAAAFVTKPLKPGSLEEVLDPLLSTDVPQVLIVDDDADARLLLGEHLTEQGIEFSVATDGREALDQLRATPALPSLVLLDIMMPNMDGFEVLDALRDDPTLRDLPVVVMTSKDLSESEHGELAPATIAVVAKTEGFGDAAASAVRTLLGAGT